MPDQETLLARVRKLLAKAEDPGVTEAEAELYNTKAAELIATYGIDQAMLAEVDKTRDEITQIKITLENPYSVDKAVLVNAIATPLRCRTVRYGYDKTSTHVIVFGFRSDLERVELLYTSLLLQATTQLTRVRPQQRGLYYRESTAAYRRSWMAGFSAAVRQRLTTAEQHAEVHHAEHTATTGRSVALVLRDRATQVDEAYKQAFPGVRTYYRRLSGSGYQSGRDAGSRADLNTTRIGGNRRAITR